MVERYASSKDLQAGQRKSSQTVRVDLAPASPDGERQAVLAVGPGGHHERARGVAAVVLARVRRDDADHGGQPQDTHHRGTHDQRPTALLGGLLLLALLRQPLTGGALSLTVLLAHIPQNEPGRRTAPPRSHFHPFE
jgi:hypothetical protein